ncbi:hypothetical protein RYX36_026633 [Vicia faba]
MFVFATPMLKFIGQPVEVAEQAGLVAIWLILFHLSFPFQFTLQSFGNALLYTLWWVFRLEDFYYRLLLIMSGYMYNSDVAIDALPAINLLYFVEDGDLPLGDVGQHPSKHLVLHGLVYFEDNLLIFVYGKF